MDVFHRLGIQAEVVTHTRRSGTRRDSSLRRLGWWLASETHEISIATQTERLR
jgi:hypothetical protein